jgi:hypothetical protein
MPSVLGIALLVDSTSVSPAVAELVQWLGSQPKLRCSLIVVAPLASHVAATTVGGPSPPSQPVQAALWRLMLAVERRRVRRSSFKAQLGTPVDLHSAPPAGGINRFKAHAEESGHQLAQRVRAALGDNRPDLIVNCSAEGSATDFASCALQGVLELAHGSGHKSSDGSSGFWEVLHQNDKTAFAVRHVSDGGAQMKTLAHGYLPTQTSFLMNQCAVTSQLHGTLKQLLVRLADGADITHMSNDVVLQPVQRDKPSASQLITYGLGVARRSITLRLLTVMGAREEWRVHYKRQDWPQLTLHDATVMANPAGGYFADPFLRATPQGLFCFVEEFRQRSQRGVISVLRMDANGPVYLGRALDEPFHLSFPYIFEFAGELYMCPEMHQAKQIRLYKCKSFPLQWELHSVAMDNVAAVDSLIFHARGKWWMLTGLLPQGDVTRFPEMHLFSAPDPISGHWQAHAQNPLKIDPEFARNGGLLRQGDKLFRVSQAHAFSAYGASINVCEITGLTESAYEELLKARFSGNAKPGVTGLHHIDSAGGLTVWDEKRWEFKFQLLRSTPNRMKKASSGAAQNGKVAVS